MPTPVQLPTFVHSTTYSSGGSNAAANSFVMPNSAGPGGLTPQAGDVAVVFATFGAGLILEDIVTGWDTVDRDQGTTSVQSWGIYSRVVQSGDPGSTFNLFDLDGGASRQAQGHMVIFRFVDNTTPVDAAVVKNKVGSVTGNPVLSDATSVTDAAMQVAFDFWYYSSQASDGTASDPSGWTLIASSSNSTTTARKQIKSYYKQGGGAGTLTGHTLDTVPDANTWMTAHLLLRPMYHRVAKTHAVSWDVAGGASRVNKTHAVSWNVASMVSEMPAFAYVAHRMGVGPEECFDTGMASYNEGASDGGEADMQLCATGETVLMHDTTIDRTASGTGTPTTGSVSALTISQWRTSRVADLDSSGLGPKPPGELDQFGDQFGAGTTTPWVLWFEMKDTGNGSSHVTNMAPYGLKGAMVVIASVRGDAQAASAAGYTVAYQTNVPNYANLAADGVTWLSVGSGSVDSTFCSTAHSNGVKVIAYTVNSTTSRDAMIAAGADAVFSDDPSVLTGSRVTKTHAVSYDVAGRATKTHAVSWNTAARVAKTHPVTWDTAARVAKTHPVSYDVAGRVTKTHPVSWNDASRVTKTHPVSYDVAGTSSRVTKTHAVAWDTLARVTKTHLVTFDAAARASKTHAVSWDVLTRVTKTHLVRWDVASDAPPLAEFYVSDGTAWVLHQPYVSNGTAWDPAEAKVSEGVGWE